MARRLLEINARKREERLAEDEEQLSKLMEVSVSNIIVATLFSIYLFPY